MERKHKGAKSREQRQNQNDASLDAETSGAVAALSSMKETLDQSKRSIFIRIIINSTL